MQRGSPKLFPRAFAADATPYMELQISLVSFYLPFKGCYTVRNSAQQPTGPPAKQESIGWAVKINQNSAPVSA